MKYDLIVFFSGLSGPKAYAAIFGSLLVCGLGVPIPEDITLISAGILAALGNISFSGAIIIGLIGVLIGDAFLFFLGRKFGPRVFTLPGLRRLMTPKRIKKAEAKIQANGRFICFIARFLPGLRSPIYLTAGVLKVSPWVFLAQDGLAALISVPLWIWFGWFFGSNIDEMMDTLKKIQVYLIVGILLTIVGYVWWKLRHRPFSST